MDNIVKRGQLGDPLSQYYNKNNFPIFGSVSSAGWHKIGQIKYDPLLTDISNPIFDLRFSIDFDIMAIVPYDSNRSEYKLNYSIILYTHQDGTTQARIQRNTELPYTLALGGQREPMLLVDVVTPLSTGSFQANIYYYNKFTSGSLCIDVRKKAIQTDRILRDSSAEMVTFNSPQLYTGNFTRPFRENVRLNQMFKAYITGGASDRYLKLFTFQNGSNERTLIDFTFDDRDTCQRPCIRVTNPNGSGVVLKGKQGLVYGDNRLFYNVDGIKINIYAKSLSGAFQDIIFKIDNLHTTGNTFSVTDIRYPEELSANMVETSTLTNVLPLPE